MKLANVDGKVCIVGDLMVDTIKECHLEGDIIKQKIEDEFKHSVTADKSIIAKLVADASAVAVETSVVKVIDPDHVPTPPPEEPEPEPEEVDEPAGGAGPVEEPPAPAAEPAPAADAPPADAPPADAPPADAPPAETPAS